MPFVDKKPMPYNGAQVFRYLEAASRTGTTQFKTANEIQE